MIDDRQTQLALGGLRPVGDGGETHAGTAVRATCLLPAPSDEDGLRGAGSDVFIADSSVALGCFLYGRDTPPHSQLPVQRLQ
jgi:hypothetical protein